MDEIVRNRLKHLLAAREPSYVLTVRFSRMSDIAGVAEASGHDAFYIDLQHSVISLDDTAHICQIGLALGITPLVRIPTINPSLIGRLLDAGAQGIIVPDIETAEEASIVARACRFPPNGSRSSAGNSNAHTHYRAMSSAAFQRGLENETLLICMLESRKGIGNASFIAAVAGVDAIQIGANDLTTSMEIPGQFRHVELQDAFRTVISACNENRKPMIVGGIREPETMAMYIEMGASRCYFTGNDAAFLVDGATRQNAAMRAMDAKLASRAAAGHMESAPPL